MTPILPCDESLHQTQGDAEFVAKKIGHDAARTRYEVDRSPRNSMAREAAAYEPPQRPTPTAQASAVSL